MKKFTYTTKYGNYENCYFIVNQYNNGNTAVTMYNDEGPITMVTLNPDSYVEPSHICIKNYSENVSMDDFMMDNGFVVDDGSEPAEGHGFIPSFPVRKLTEKFYEYVAK